MHPEDVDKDLSIIDPRKGLEGNQLHKLKLRQKVEASRIKYARHRFNQGDYSIDLGSLETEVVDCAIYEHDDFPGQLCSIPFHTRILIPALRFRVADLLWLTAAIHTSNLVIPATT